MSDNTQLSERTGDGDTIRDLAEVTTGVKWPVAVAAYVTGGSAGAWALQYVTTTVGLPVAVVGTVPVSGTFWQTTQPVSVASLPLPSGSATSAKQDTGNASLSSIDGKTPALGQALAAASVPVVLTASQITTLTPPAAITGFATAANQATGNASLASIDGKITAVNTGAVVVSSSALPSGAATAAAQVTGNASLASIDGKAPALGQALAAASVLVVLTAAQISTLTPLATVAATQSGAWAVTQSGTWNVATVTTVSDASVQGKAAHDAAVSGNPVLIGGYASTTAPTSVTAGDVAQAWYTLKGAANVHLVTAAGAGLGDSAVTPMYVVESFLESNFGASNETPAADDSGSYTFMAFVKRHGAKLTDIETNTDSGAVVGNGAAATAQRVTIANDSTGVLAGVTTVTTVTTVSAVTAITNALPAGTNLLGKVSASAETSTMYDGTTALTPKFAAIAASSSGNNTLVAAVTSKKIRVLAYNLMGAGAVNAKFQSGASGTDLTGLKYIAAAGGGICAPFNPAGWFETASNTLLNLNLSGAVAVGGELVYVEV